MRSRALVIFSTICLCVFLLAAITHLCAKSPYLMYQLMTHYAPPETTGLPAAEYAPVAKMITRYLQTGRNFQHTYVVDGMEYVAFNAKEQAHMADVHSLFFCSTWVCWVLLILSFGCLLQFDSNAPWKSLPHMLTFRHTLIAVLAVVTAVIILACIDFNSLFVLFHKVAFTNDLWLLNPQTDLLIRLMPIEFFISYAAIMGGMWLAGMVAMLVVSTIRIKKLKANEGE
ncbi:MAG: TIGR01906 family membrane protein [Clostridia bacterium]|nr:TIGR01906 family membrane protein [Clostridia bacterium]MBQ3155438.1 TIGR01906 family membrane protein [Clostridia bacterium]MBQ7139470.1 TIGR01906 family membrane protein [Clostridia bacterium]